jgi:hypothetical protein
VRPSYDDHCTARCVRGFIPVANVLSYSHCGRAIGQQSNDCWLTNISVSPDHALAFAFSTSWTNYIRFFPAFSPHYGCVTFRSLEFSLKHIHSFLVRLFRLAVRIRRPQTGLQHDDDDRTVLWTLFRPENWICLQKQKENARIERISLVQSGIFKTDCCAAPLST